MRRLLYTAFVMALLVLLGCHVVEKPSICHVFPDGASLMSNNRETYIQQPPNWVEIDGVCYQHFNMVWQHGPGEFDFFGAGVPRDAGDQWLYTKTLIDDTCSVIPIDTADCAWFAFEECWTARSWNPCWGDEGPDFELDILCPGALSVMVMVEDCAVSTTCSGILHPWPEMWDRTEKSCACDLCGEEEEDNSFDSEASLAALLVELAANELTSYHGRPAYRIALESPAVSMKLTNERGATEEVPLNGGVNLFVTDTLAVGFQFTSEARDELLWIRDWINANGTSVSIRVRYGSLDAGTHVRLRPQAIEFYLQEL